MEVGFFKQGSAQAARTMNERLAVLRDLLRESDLELADSRHVRDLRAFEQRGAHIRALLIDIVHGDGVCQKFCVSGVI
jgi:hypothetical protein